MEEILNQKRESEGKEERQKMKIRKNKWSINNNNEKWLIMNKMKNRIGKEKQEKKKKVKRMKIIEWICSLWSWLDFALMLFELATWCADSRSSGGSLVRTSVSHCPCLALSNLPEACQGGAPSSSAAMPPESRAGSVSGCALNVPALRCSPFPHKTMFRGGIRDLARVGVLPVGGVACTSSPSQGYAGSTH